MPRTWIKRLAVILGVAIAAAPATAATFHGEFWDASTAITNLTQADAIIAAGPATATFESTRIDYPAGSGLTIGSGSSLATFLGADAATLSGSSTVAVTRSVFRFTGFLDILGGNTIFRVSSDDGFRLKVGGVQISSFNGTRSFGATSVTRNLASGLTPFELVYFENAGQAGIEFRVNGALAVPSAVSLPASLGLLMASILGLGVVARKRRTVAA
jgi:hypothetical protein